MKEIASSNLRPAISSGMEEVLKYRGRSVTTSDAADAVTEFCDRIRSLAYDKDEENYDETRLAALVQPVHNLFRNTSNAASVGPFWYPIA